MSHRLHFYKGYEIRNVKKKHRSAFHIIRDNASVAATTTLKSATWLIDVWDESPYCACGALRLPHDFRCAKCVKGGIIDESQLLRQHRRVG